MSSFFLVLCLNGLVFFASAAATSEVRLTAKRFQNSLSQQNIQTVLISIEERLRNLDSIYSMQYSPSVEGRLEHYGRKLENVEAKISRMEAVMRNELDKISENISSRNFKDDIAKDHVLRKIDSVYERINSRLVYAEIKLEMTERKLDDKLMLVLSRLDKMEDDISTKDANMAMEFADVIAVIDEIKSTTSTIENKIVNITKLINNTQNHQTDLIQSDQSKMSEKIRSINTYLEDNLRHVKENLATISLLNDNFTATLKKELQEDFNMFANKVVDFHDSSWKSYDRLENGIKSIAAVANLTRYEIQNGLRSLTLLIGKKHAPNMLSDSYKGNVILEKLDKKIDSNFESVMLAQNLFLESCYRVQKDESQLETKISEVLEQLIDTFEQKTSLQPRDLNNLEQLIRNHDLHARRSSNNLASSVGTLLERTNANEKKTDENRSLLKNSIDELSFVIRSNFGLQDNSNKLNEFISVLKDLRAHLTAIDDQIKQDFQKSTFNMTAMHDIKTVLTQLHNITTNATTLKQADIEEIEEHIKHIYSILQNIELEINKWKNKHGIDAAVRNSTAERDSKRDRIIWDIFGQNNKTIPQNTTANRKPISPELIFEIFGRSPNFNKTQEKTQDSSDGRIIFDTKTPGTSTVKNCSNNLPVHAIDIRNGENLEPNCLDVIQQVRTNNSNGENKSSSTETSSTTDGYSATTEEETIDEFGNRESLEDISAILNASYTDEMSSYYEENTTDSFDYSQGSQLEYD